MVSRIKLVEQEEVTGELAGYYDELKITRGGLVPNLFKALGYSEEMLGPAIGVAGFVSATSKLPAKD